MIDELMRKAVHICIAVSLAILAYLGLLEIWMLGLFTAITLSLIVFLKNVEVPLFSGISRRLARKDKFLGEGAVYMFLGTMIVLLLFDSETIVAASIMVLAFGDSMAAYVGILAGKISMPFSKDKKLEGFLAGLVFASLGASFFVPWPLALYGSFAAMLYETYAPDILLMDDNVWVPVISAAIFWAFL